ncbi:MAG TPA: hypothetical protein VGC85_02410 [Chthoniobacterales bacterium]
MATHNEPELIYLPPNSDLTSVPIDPSLGNASFEEKPRVETRPATAQSPTNSHQPELLPDVAQTDRARTIAASSPPKLEAREIMLAASDATRFALAARSQTNAHQVDPIVQGSAGVEIAVVPEPSSGAIVALISGLLLCARARRRP